MKFYSVETIDVNVSPNVPVSLKSRATDHFVRILSWRALHVSATGTASKASPKVPPRCDDVIAVQAGEHLSVLSADEPGTAQIEVLSLTKPRKFTDAGATATAK